MVATRVRSGDLISDNRIFDHPLILAFLESSSSARGVHDLIEYGFNYEVLVFSQESNIFRKINPDAPQAGPDRAVVCTF